MSIAALCIAWLGAAPVEVPADGFTLAWTHSIERTRWREEWRLEGGMLRAGAAEVQGSGAGMEPPPGAVRMEDGWRWTQDLPPQERLVLAASPHGGDHELCVGGTCRPLRGWLPPGEGPISLSACRGG